MSNIIIGTAGHIDHGKTTLIKALTGIETDRTEEEKTRGMSINLGFAYFDLPSGRRVGVIDVPGHEKFIKNMLAGAQGINMIMLVIDANEGIMPQTVEHASILNLLGIEDYIIVLTKCDLVEEEMLDIVEEDIRSRFVGTPIEKADIVRVDSLSGRGLKELAEKVDAMADSFQEKKINSEPRLNIDRVFTVKGFGTVVTGTLVEGEINLDDELMIYTGEIPVKVRNIQVHEKNVPKAFAGQRTAVNLLGVKAEDIRRGDVLTTEGNLNKSYIIDAKIKVLPEFVRPLSLWNRVRVYIGTREVMARVVPLGLEDIAPGSEGFIQLRLEEEVVAKPGDRLILRNYSPMMTLGGGIVLEPNSVKHHRFDEEMLRQLEIKEKNDIDEVITDFLDNREGNFASLKEILDSSSSDNDIVAEKVRLQVEEGKIVKFDERYISVGKINELRSDFVRNIKDFHDKYPLKAGMQREELKSKMKYSIKPKDYDLIFDYLLGLGTFTSTGTVVKLPDFTVKYTKAQKNEFDRINKALLDDGFSPRSIKDFGKEKITQEVIDSMYESYIIKLNQDVIMHKEYFVKAYNIMMEYARKNGSITLAQFRDEIDASRKYAMALLEYFDKMNITRRIEDKRELTGKELSF